MLAVLDGEALWNDQGRRVGKILRRLPRRRQGQHERRRGALSGVRRERRPAGEPRAAHQPVRASMTRRRRRSPTRARRCWRCRPISACSRAASRSRRPTIRGSSRSSTRAARRSTSARASSICPARNATTTTGARALPATPCRRRHPTGYPIYRLEWQSLGSLQRRLRNCMIGMRAEAYAYGAPEYVDMELYLMWRARGMKMETPAVRP